MTKKIGRPNKEIDWNVLDAVLQYGASKLDCADLLNVSEDTVDKKIKQSHKMTFSEYREKKMGKMRIKLLQKQYEVAMNGNVALLIWLGKQHLGQSEKQEIDVGENAKKAFSLAYKIE